MDDPSMPTRNGNNAQNLNPPGPIIITSTPTSIPAATLITSASSSSDLPSSTLLQKAQETPLPTGTNENPVPVGQSRILNQDPSPTSYPPVQALDGAALASLRNSTVPYIALMPPNRPMPTVVPSAKNLPEEEDLTSESSKAKDDKKGKADCAKDSKKKKKC
ncbi:hypothetical protein HMI56_003163 [Coelomomyces lativittatus]|nr:hypothetical protein HMI56_003163 [Coelomomyces lativittatus]